MRRECLVLGLVMIVAGLLKMADPGHFQAMLSRYGLFPLPLLPYVSPLIIAGEILLGLALLSGWQTRHCLAVCEVLFYIFALTVASVLYRGLQIHCACFGVFSLKVSVWHCLICLGVALYLSWRRQHKAIPPVPGSSRFSRPGSAGSGG